MAGTPALRPTAKRFSPILLPTNLRQHRIDASFGLIPSGVTTVNYG